MSHEAVIRVLDGPALCNIAFSLGLAPEGTDLWDDMPYGMLYAFAQRELWEPDVNLVQADAVFRALRALGYTTSCLWNADDRQYGEAWVSAEGRQAWSVQWSVPADEALALLRVSVLAVASAQEGASWTI